MALRWMRTRVSVLFSEPKIPQLALIQAHSKDFALVSVLFSEPKIPQYAYTPVLVDRLMRFQCSSASRKFLNRHQRPAPGGDLPVSVLFSEPKIPQCYGSLFWANNYEMRFSALQRAENSSIPSPPPPPRHAVAVSVLFSEPKIPQ